MRKFLRVSVGCCTVLAAIMMAGAQPAMAQGAKAEVFGGASFLRSNSATYSGWDASVTGNLLPWLGATADFGGNYNSPLSILTYTFGPRLAVPQDSGLVPFTQATFGVARLSAFGTSDSGFGMYIGGGMDWIVTEHVAVRLMQLDAQFISVGGISESGTRFAFGVVLRLGSR